MSIDSLNIAQNTKIISANQCAMICGLIYDMAVQDCYELLDKNEKFDLEALDNLKFKQ